MNLRFPLHGIDKGHVTSEQPEFTSPDLKNVRPYDALNNRMRGGQRPGLDKWGAGTQVGVAGGTGQPIVAICTVNSVI